MKDKSETVNLINNVNIIFKMQSNQVFITDYIGINYLKRYSFFFNNLIVYPRELQSGGILNSSYRDPYNNVPKYCGDKIIEWLFKNNIIKVIINDEELEQMFNDKSIVGFNLGLKDFILENHKKICLKNKLDKNENDILTITSELDNKDKILIQYINKLRYQLFQDDYKRTLLERGLKLDMVPGLKKSLNNLYKIQTRHNPIIKDFTWLNKDLISETKIANALHCNNLQYGFYKYKFQNIKFDAKSLSDTLNESLKIDFLNNKDIDNLSFNKISEIRKTKHWNKAMVELFQLTEGLSQNEKEFNDEVKEIKSRINDEIFNSIEETGFKKDFKETVKNVSKQFTLGQIPILNTLDSANPLYKYFFKRKKNSLVYFMKEYRTF